MSHIQNTLYLESLEESLAEAIKDGNLEKADDIIDALAGNGFTEDALRLRDKYFPPCGYDLLDPE